ncbi:MAG: type I DNA topoisomerase, partial [Candidatus Binatia bacterium]
MAKPLVIVESPAKAKTIAGILGGKYVVESSIGHVRDLPNGAAEIPDSHRGKSWARIGVDVDNDFEPLYIVPPAKKKQVSKLKELLKKADALYLATDEDREGEAIAWHLKEVLKPKVPVKRMVFHEITRAAIQNAVDHPREIDQRLVDAQETRRILDRLVGYEISPVLWKRITRGLSAGRVQSVATRMLVERERARMAFRKASYWDVEGRFTAEGSEFIADLAGLDGKRIASGRDFDETGGLASAEVARLDEALARGLVQALDGAEFEVRSVEEKPWRRSPSPPFMTSTLQQEALRKERFSVHKTMRLAQSLYERGFITYMRTDSVTLSREAVEAARRQASELYGREFITPEPRTYPNKSKNAQEAHEAIRPAGDVFRKPEEIAPEVSPDEARLYTLIWKRTIASQMSDARGQSTTARLGTRDRRGRDVEFSATGKVIEFFGFLRAYVEGADDTEAALDDQQKVLPPLAVGDRPKVVALEPKGHETNPPPRYTEASLVKALEEKGVGRPSTYASIIDTIERRGYVFKRGSALVPSWTAFAVTQLLERHFENLVDYAFTARMEDDLDEIAGGGAKSGPYLKRFYLGDGEIGLRDQVADRLEKIDARQVCS